MRFLIIGGDRRMLAVRQVMLKKGFSVDTLGLIPEEHGDIRNTDCILLPVPLTRDGVYINCPVTDEKIPLELFCSLPENIKVFGGGKLDIKNYTDYLALDEYALKNAVLTAEGAISYAIESTDFSLWNSRILIIGYGRVGKILTERLLGFKPRLTVSARNKRDFAMLDALGINRIETGKIASCNLQFDIVFNTVDIKLDSATENALSPCLFIDLSSKGGFLSGEDLNRGISYVKLPGIPGKTAPITAGEIIAETVIEYLM